MKPALERRWTKLLNSRGWRRFTGSSPIGAALRSPLVRRADMTRRRIVMGRRAAAAPNLFSSVRTFCLFVGHTKSGGSILGAFLDAHPRIVMADELDALKYVAAGFDSRRLYHLIDKAARRESLKGRVTARRLEPYSLAVPDQWQGRYDTIEVVGDVKAGIATQRLGHDPEALAALRRLVDPAAVRLIHVVRNPFDPIAVMTIRGGRTFENAIGRYFANCSVLAELHEQLPGDTIEIVRYEHLVERPRAVLEAICRFLDVDATDDYLAACAAVIRGEPSRERSQVDWSDSIINDIETRVAEYSFLAGYTFES